MLLAFAKDRPRFTLEFDTATLVVLLATLKTGINTPGYPEFSKKQMLGFVSELLRCFEPSPALAALMRSEWGQIATVSPTRSLAPIIPERKS